MIKPFFILILLFAYMPDGMAQRKLSLQQAIDSALARNLDVQGAGLQAERAGVELSQARSNRLPSVNAALTHGINKGRSIDPFTNSFVNQTINFANYGLGTGVTLFNGFNLKNSVKQFAFANDASKARLQQARDELTLNVIIAYLTVLNNEDLVVVADQQVDVLMKQVQRLRVLDSSGAIAPSQLSELLGQTKEGELNAITFKGRLESSKLDLLQLLNLPYDPSLQLERTGLPTILDAPKGSADVIYKQALDSLSAIRAAELNIKSAEYGIKASKGLLSPSLALNGSVNTNYSSLATQSILLNTSDVATSNYVVVNGTQVPVFTQKEFYNVQRIGYGRQLDNNLFYNIGLSLRIPILNSFVSRNRVRLAKIEWKNAVLLEESIKVQVRQQVEQAYLNYINAWNRYKVLSEQVTFFSEAFKAAEARFNAGVGTSVDYILARNNYDRASLNLIIASYDYLFRGQVINFYTGVKPK